MKILFKDGDEVKPFQVDTAEALRAEIKQVGAWACGRERPSGTGQEGGKPEKPPFPSDTFSLLKKTTGRQDQTAALQAEVDTPSLRPRGAHGHDGGAAGSGLREEKGRGGPACGVRGQVRNWPSRTLPSSSAPPRPRKVQPRKWTEF